MKSSGQTKDGGFDNLLRAYVSRPSNPHQVCADFDPDQANAYIERGLTGSMRTRYEQHLSQCPPCRKSVVALTRLAESDGPAVVSGVREPAAVGTGWLDGARRMLGALAQPRWAMAAAAIIVAAISLPLILSRSELQQSKNPAAEQVASAHDSREADLAAQAKSAETAPSAFVSTRQRENNAEKAQLLAKNQPVPTAATEAAAGAAAGADLSKKLAETSSVAEPVDELKRKSESQVAAAPQAAGAAPGSQVARGDVDQNRQQQQSKDAGQQTGDAKTVARSEEERSKERSERADEVAQPPAPRAPAESARGRSGFRRALRDANTEAVKPEERKFNGKTFLFRDGAWTDKGFDPNKDLPSVTIIRDSNVYNEVLNKRPGLKPFLTGFHASERAIIVYKGMVYKLIPQ